MALGGHQVFLFEFVNARIAPNGHSVPFFFTMFNFHLVATKVVPFGSCKVKLHLVAMSCHFFSSSNKMALGYHRMLMSLQGICKLTT
jgi:hypothetical protein